MELLEFVKQKLEEHAPELLKYEQETFKNTNTNPLITLAEDPVNYKPTVLYPNIIEEIKDELLKSPYFKGVKQINVINSPVFHGDKETGEPLSLDCDYLGDESRVKTYHCPSLLLNEDTLKAREGGDGLGAFNEESNLNEVIDIYTISITPVIYDPAVISKETQKPGVWIHPMSVDVETFVPIKKITVAWSPENMQDYAAMSEEDIRENLIRQFTEALDNNDVKDTNIPNCKKQSVMVRLSPRSFKQLQENEVAK